ncbi:HEAT repeat domain-containing protein [Bacteroidota bacterium]
MKKLIINIILVSSLFISFQVSSTVIQVDRNFDGDIINETKQLLEILSVYNFGDSRAWLNDFQDLLRRIHKNPEIYPEIEDLMIEFLQSDATMEGKQYICKQIGLIGSKQSVPVLSKMLLDISAFNMALLALEPINDKEVDKALIKALSKTKGITKTGIINSLGVRKTPEAVNPLSKLIFDKDHLISSSSIAALGKIGNMQASISLGTAYQKAEIPLKWSISDAWLKSADNISSYEETYPIYAEVYKDNPPVSIKTAALNGLINTYTGESSDYLVAALKDPDPEMQEAVIPLIRNLDMKNDMEVYIKELPNLKENLRIQLVLAIAARRDPAAHDLLLSMIKSKNQDQRLSALMVFPDHAKSSDVVFLASFASKSKGRERDMARECLNSMSGDNINDAILTVAQKACPEERVELIRAIGYRNIISGIDILLISAKHTERKVRIESFKTLGKIGSPDYLPEIIELMIKSESSAERKEAEKAITSIATTKDDESTQSDEILKVIPAVKTLNAKISCINILGNLGTEKSLPVLREYLISGEYNIRVAAIKALSEWPDASPRKDLLGIVLKTKDIKQHTLAIQGYVRLTLIDNNLREDDKATALKETMELSENTNEQKIVIAGIARVQSLSALRQVIKLLDRKELQNEAEAAVIDISRKVGELHPEKTRAILNQLLNDSQNPEFKSAIEERLKWMK